MNEGNKHTDLLSKWLAGELSEEEQKQLASEQKSLEALRHVIDDIDQWKSPEFDIEKGLNQLNARKQTQTHTKTKTRRLNLNMVFAIAASIALILVVVIGWDYYFNSTIEYFTSVGEKQEITFPQGSTAMLDAVSSISYNKRTWDGERIVKLAGQALFDVTSGDSFTVTTQRGKVAVLGTKFNVKATDNDFKVQCIEGQVQVQSGSASTTLQEGQSTELIDDQFNTTQSEGKAPSWTQGYSTYDDTPLANVMEDLRTYYQVDFALPSKYAQLKYEGQFSHDNLETALQAILGPMEIRYQLSSDNYIEFVE